MEDNNKEDKKFTVSPTALFRDLKDSCGMFFAVIRGKFKVRLSSVIWCLLGVLYFILPLDFLPEAFFSLLGFGDDLLVLIYILNQIRPDIERYRQFKLAQKEIKKEEKNEKDI